MARITSIGMPKKAFVASAADEAAKPEVDDTGQSSKAVTNSITVQPEVKKRKRRGTRGKDPAAGAIDSTIAIKGRWGRDPTIAKRTKLNAEHSESRRITRIHEKHVATTCFACRSVGHAARDCPNVLLASSGGGSADLLLPEHDKKGYKSDEAMKRRGGKKGGDVTGGKCYRCNATDHSLSGCSEPVDPKDPTPYATCFICLATGHLSSLCPSNPGRGIYVNGGNCKLCGSTAHRARDCAKTTWPVEGKDADRPKQRRSELVLGQGQDAGADEDDFMVTSRGELKGIPGKGKRKKHPPAKNGERPNVPARPDEIDRRLDVTGGGEVEALVPSGVSAAKPSGTKAKAKVVKF